MKTIYIKDLGHRLFGKKAECYLLGAGVLCAMFLLGNVLAEDEAVETAGNANARWSLEGQYVADGTATEETASGRILQDSSMILGETENWGLGFGKAGERPSGNVSASELAKYDAFYCAETEDKILYLTFDCGFENGNTEAILDALKKHNVKATFFVVGHYLETAPELVKRMVDEGHIVANHTYHHPDMSKISDAAAFQKEMDATSDLYQEIVGEEMPMYYRPPQGKYSIDNLQMAKELGYKTFFWSLAYVDWNQDSQPSHEEAYGKLTTRVHPGAIVLLHNTSKTNGEIMDGILTKWEEMGYCFGSLEDLCGDGTRESGEAADTEQDGNGRILQDGGSVNKA